MPKFNYRKVSYEIKIINKTINFLKGVIKKTYSVTKIICNCGVVQKVIIGFVTVVIALGLRFGNLKSVDPIIHSQTLIERQLQHSSSTQPSQAMKGSKSPSVSNLLKLYVQGGAELGKGSSPGARARNDARKVTGMAEAWTTNPTQRSRPEAANRMAQQYQTVPARNGNGLFGRFTARPTPPDPYNPGCAGGPRTVTVLSGQQRNSDLSTNLTAYDGFEAQLTDKSLNHLTSKHGHEFGVDDRLPIDPNQKPTKYEQIRTRVNNENKAKVREEINSILSNPKTDVYTDVSIRGILGRVYHCKYTNRVVGIHTEGKFEGQIMKAQPISRLQLDCLRKLNKLD